jgi:hypothetical protein
LGFAREEDFSTARAAFSKFSQDFGPSWYSCFTCSHYPLEKLVARMWIPRQLKSLIDVLRSELSTIHKAIDNQTQANREANKASEAQWDKVPGIIAAIRPTQHEIADSQARYDQNYRQQERSIGIQRRLMIATYCAFVAAAVYALLACFQWRDLRENFHADERAYVLLDATELKVIENPWGLHFQTGFRNTGKTPAYRVNSFCGVRGNLEEIPARDSPVAHGQMTLPPSGVDLCAVDLHNSSLNEIRGGTQMYFFGTVWYEDAFRSSHWSQFCYSPWYPNANEIGFIPCDRHALSDGEPER